MKINVGDIFLRKTFNYYILILCVKPYGAYTGMVIDPMDIEPEGTLEIYRYEKTWLKNNCSKVER